MIAVDLMNGEHPKPMAIVVDLVRSSFPCF